MEETVVLRHVSVTRKEGGEDPSHGSLEVPVGGHFHSTPTPSGEEGRGGMDNRTVNRDFHTRGVPNKLIDLTPTIKILDLVFRRRGFFDDGDGAPQAAKQGVGSSRLMGGDHQVRVQAVAKRVPERAKPNSMKHRVHFTAVDTIRGDRITPLVKEGSRAITACEDLSQNLLAHSTVGLGRPRPGHRVSQEPSVHNFSSAVGLDVLKLGTHNLVEVAGFGGP